MPDGKLIERRLDGQTLVQGHFLKVCRDRVELPDGTVTTREYVVHPGPDGQSKFPHLWPPQSPQARPVGL